MLLNAIVVNNNSDFSEVKEYEEFDAMLSEIGIKKKKNGTYSHFETMLLNEHDPQYEGIGILAIDQDETKKKENILGIKGKFLVVGMKRLEPGTETNTHLFEALTEEQIAMVKKQIDKAIVIKAMFRR